jgi:hypothetical protein
MKRKKEPHVRVRKPVLKQAVTSAKIRVRLDHRTFVTIHDMSALKLWKVRYPDATVVSTL